MLKHIMATNNYLFSILTKATSVTGFTIKTNSDNVPYAMFELPLSQPRLLINDIPFRVIEQHLSIYKDLTDFSRNSLYHCSILLSHPDGKIHKLRAYYDQEDKLIGNISLKTEDPSPKKLTETIEIPKTESVALNQLIQALASPPVRLLVSMHKKEKAQQRHLKMLKRRYSAEAKMLEAKIITNQDFNTHRISELKQSITFLHKQLQEITTIQTNFTDPRIARLQNLLAQKQRQWQAEQSSQPMPQKKQLPLSTSPQATAKKPSAMSTEVIKQALSSSQAGTKVTPKKTSPQSSTKKQRKTPNKTEQLKAKLAQQQQSINEDLKKLMIESTANDTHIINIKELLQRLSLFDLQLIENGLEQDYQLWCEQTKAEIEDFCTTVFITAIANNQKAFIQKYLAIAPVVPDEVLKYAINNNNPSLIQAFFQKSHTPINHLSIDNASQPNQPLLQYAYEHKLDLAFEALFKLGANSLTPLENGQPLLHELLSKPYHRFYPLAMQYIYSKGRATYFAQLSIQLEDYLNAHSLPEPQKIELRGALETYKILKTLSLPLSDRELALRENHQNLFITGFIGKLSPELQQKLEQDERFQQAKNAYLRQYADIAGTLTPKQFLQFNHKCRETVDDYLRVSKITDLKSIELETVIEAITKQTKELPEYKGWAITLTDTNLPRASVEQIAHSTNKKYEKTRQLGATVFGLRAAAASLQTEAKTLKEQIAIACAAPANADADSQESNSPPL